MSQNRNKAEDGYCLVIAEKPSVAQSIAKVIGASDRKNGYLEGSHYLVSWCLGHLVELAMPEAYSENYAKWRYEDLPILPQFTDSGWQYQVSEATKKQFAVLKELMHRKDVTSICLATDAGREGELIGRLVYHQCKCEKPMQRLWISSMEDQAIVDGFDNLKPSCEYDSLYEAALCRERADWMVGINATRLFSCLYHQNLNVGRVMTPTLAMVVLRDAEIMAFKPEAFYTVQLHLPGFTAVSGRFADEEQANALANACQSAGQARVTKAERKEKSEHAPALYDLTSLQRDANRILGFTAQQTLDYAQALYEKKLITYPRTDSRYLTEDMAGALPDWVNGIAGKFGIPDFMPDADACDQVINSSKVTDHHAIIPTKSCKNASLEELPSGELQICRLIAGRFLASVNDSQRYTKTVCEVVCGDQVFTTKGREILADGWKAIEARFRPAKKDAEKKKGSDQSKEQATFPLLEEGQLLTIITAEIKEGKTSAAKRFTEDSLLAAMEAAGASEGTADKVNGSEGAREGSPVRVERKGLGTPATRAGIIEKLIRTGLISRQGDKKTKYLTATDKGISLITVMPEQIQSPSMTADWENKLLQVEQEHLPAEEFMDEITRMVTDLVQNYKAVEGADVLMNQKHVLGVCPHCGAEVVERPKGWFCSDKVCKFVLWKDNAYFNSLGKKLTGSMAEKLIREGRLKLKDCKSRKSGKNFNATVVLQTDETGKAFFSLEFEQKPEREKGKKGIRLRAASQTERGRVSSENGATGICKMSGHARKEPGMRINRNAVFSSDEEMMLMIYFHSNRTGTIASLEGELVTGYECDPMTCDEEFLLSKREYQQKTGRTRIGGLKNEINDIIAYLIRQSFKPGEITADEANRVGYETVLRFTKGKHAFIIQNSSYCFRFICWGYSVNTIKKRRNHMNGSPGC